MRILIVCMTAVGAWAGSAFAGSSATLSPLAGSRAAAFDDGMVHGYGWEPGLTGGAGVSPFNIYDNVPTFLGGTATGWQGPFGDLISVYAFADWINPSAQYGDDLHQLGGGKGPVLVTSLHFFYMNTVATTTHLIKFYGMVTPSATHGSLSGILTPVTKGALLTTITVPGLPIGTFQVDLSLALALPSSVWIKFQDVGPAAGSSLWLTGGLTGANGDSQTGLAYTLKDQAYNAFLPRSDDYYVPSMGYVNQNIVVGLSGLVIPTPGVITVLAIGGVMSLRRRRPQSAGDASTHPGI